MNLHCNVPRADGHIPSRMGFPCCWSTRFQRSSGAAETLRYFNRRIDLQRAQVLGEVRSQVRALQRKLYSGFQKAQLVSGIMALAFKGISVNLFARAEQPAQSVSKLQFTAGPERSSFQGLKNCWRENITPNNGQV